MKDTISHAAPLGGHAEQLGKPPVAPSEAFLVGVDVGCLAITGVGLDVHLVGLMEWVVCGTECHGPSKQWLSLLRTLLVV
jgi:hypothetical protein